MRQSIAQGRRDGQIPKTNSVSLGGGRAEFSLSDETPMVCPPPRGGMPRRGRGEYSAQSQKKSARSTPPGASRHPTLGGGQSACLSEFSGKPAPPPTLTEYCARAGRAVVLPARSGPGLRDHDLVAGAGRSGSIHWLPTAFVSSGSPERAHFRTMASPRFAETPRSNLRLRVASATGSLGVSCGGLMRCG